MGNTIYGLPSAAQSIKYYDAYKPHFNALWSVLGTNTPTETTTSAALASTARSVLLGDGGSNVGLGNPGLELAVKDIADSIVMSSRGDVYYRRQMAAYFDAFDQVVQSALPTQWNFYSGTATSVTDAHFLRLNAAHSGVPTTPASAPTVTALADSAGGMPPTTSGAAPLIKFTLVGAYDYDESLPSPASTAVAILNSQNALQFTPAGTVPAGVTKLRAYRTTYGPGATYYYVGDFEVTAGASFPTIILRLHDAALRTDITPPSWMSCSILSESAGMYAMSKGTISSQAGLADSRQMTVDVSQFLSAENVAINYQDAYAYGFSSSIQRAIYATWSGSTTLNTIKTSNTNDAQGYIGSLGGLQAKVTSAINAAGTATLTYTYISDTTGFGSPATQSGVTSTSFSGTGVGSTATWTIPAGRVVRSVTALSVTGIASGTFVVSGIPPR